MDSLISPFHLSSFAKASLYCLLSSPKSSCMLCWFLLAKSSEWVSITLISSMDALPSFCIHQRLTSNQHRLMSVAYHVQPFVVPIHRITFLLFQFLVELHVFPVRPLMFHRKHLHCFSFCFLSIKSLNLSLSSCDFNLASPSASACAISPVDSATFAKVSTPVPQILITYT